MERGHKKEVIGEKAEKQFLLTTSFFFTLHCGFIIKSNFSDFKTSNYAFCLRQVHVQTYLSKGILNPLE